MFLFPLLLPLSLLLLFPLLLPFTSDQESEEDEEEEEMKEELEEMKEELEEMKEVAVRFGIARGKVDQVPVVM